MNAEKKIIAWPLEDDARQTADHYSRTCGFPGIMAQIDGTHIPILKPDNYPNSYLNRKGVHSIQLMTVCNQNFKFLIAYTGEVGCVDEDCVLDRSGLMTLIREGILNLIPIYN